LLNEQASWYHDVAEINAVYCGIYCQKYWQKIMKIGDILKQMYFRRKPNKN